MRGADFDARAAAYAFAVAEFLGSPRQMSPGAAALERIDELSLDFGAGPLTQAAQDATVEMDSKIRMSGVE